MTQKKKIKTKEVKKILRKKWFRRYCPLIFLCIVGLASGFYLYKHTPETKYTQNQKQSASTSKSDSSKDEKSSSRIKPWYTYHSVAHAMGGWTEKIILIPLTDSIRPMKKVIGFLRWTSS